jgi:hypothetical protein
VLIVNDKLRRIKKNFLYIHVGTGEEIERAL